MTRGRLITYAVNTAVLTAIDTTLAVRSGTMNRKEQRQIILNQTRSVTKGAVPAVMIIGCILALCPWLALPVTVARFLGLVS